MRGKYILLMSCLTIPVLTACGAFTVTPAQGPTLEVGKPPPAKMNIGEEGQPAGVGTYCWPQPQGPAMCADALGIPTAQEAINTSSPFTANFEIPINRAPTVVRLTVIPVGLESEMEMQAGGYRWWQPQPGKVLQLPAENLPKVEMDLKPGLYVLNLFVSWNNFGDASYGFLVRVN